MFPDLTKMEELQCSDCHAPIAFSQVGDASSTTFELHGCQCDREFYHVPDGGGLFGISGGLFTVFMPRTGMIQ